MNHLSQQASVILSVARDVAHEYGLGYIGTEHLLLAIAREGNTLAAEALRDLGANEYALQSHIDELIKDRKDETWVVGRLPGTPHYRDVISSAASQARGTGNWQVAPEHVLLALLDEHDSTAYRALQSLGISSEELRKELRRRQVGGSVPG